ncbi:ABC transporter ATP-binding protein [Flavilitoribacter nigricans]|uniref:ABC transporter ATP-binding protein n=1 Tax=Flavilitoribacter nigricans (strain ATCC 23147 / DSM 23189 / NBRC 102662 / NCIMB 1420 / SS-2) TaxID=1122177 RepID=A0A2D0N451_FLAN2|nr:ATP-binding cassette domain-containing protein [Flavilitoribacter nigricans]PHN03332.1 ABC transporter ATP-binding protein [Flavilitoribacter nigricans DSM 23189 = NBRC 102662]
MDVLQLQDVVKQYHRHKAVDEVSFSVPQGSIFGLLGPNGAGKTSLIRIITTITRADTGHVFFEGEPLNTAHPMQIGYMPEERGLYKKMKVGEHLIYLARLKGLDKATARQKINAWLEKFEITDWWNKKVDELSKGMQQKIQFISTVVHEPRLLILDEPFSGLDPINTNLIKEEIFKLHQSGTTIIFSTHRMEQVEEICEYIVLINKGQNVLEGKVADIKENFKENLYELEPLDTLPTSLEEIATVVNERNGIYKVKLTEGVDSTNLLRYLLDHGVRLRAFREVLPSLNEIFIRQVNQL